MEEAVRADGRGPHDDDHEEGADEQHVRRKFGGDEVDQIERLRFDHIGYIFVYLRVLPVPYEQSECRYITDTDEHLIKHKHLI